MAARHVAIIMDGNGRWARDHGVEVHEGHREGARALKRTVRNAVDLGIRELTVYAFSTENWARPAAEVDGIMALFVDQIASETPELREQGVRLRFMGRREAVAPDLRERMRWAEQHTAASERMTLFVAFNYGGRAEILDAAAAYSGGGEEAFRELLYAPDMAEPELLVRTSGERRLSNFLLWQCAYSELVFSETLWPDFDREDLEAALEEFAARERRFGTRPR